MKNFKKVLATLCSVTLIVGSSVTAFATDPDPDSTPASGTTPATTEAGAGNIIAFSVDTVTVPTAVKVSFNPQGWDFTVRGTGDDATISNNQIVSLNYGIATDATLDKKIKVSFTAVASDNASGTKDVEFVDSAEEAQAKSSSNTKGAAPGEYKMYLAVAPSDAAVDTAYAAADGAETALEVDSTTKKTTVTTALLGDVKMDPATVGVQAFKDNKAEISYKLDKAEYEMKDTAVINFATTDISSMFDTKTLGSIVGFTFVGAMNPNVDWTKAKISALAITPVYEVEEVDGTETVLSGDGAPYNVIGEASAAEVEPTATTVEYDSTNKIYTVSLAAAVTGISDVTNLKVNGSAVSGTLNGSKNKVKIVKDDIKTALGSAWDSTTNLEFTFTVDGTNYKATIAR